MIHKVKREKKLKPIGWRRLEKVSSGEKKKESILAKGREGDMGEPRRQGQKRTLPSVRLVCFVR